MNNISSTQWNISGTLVDSIEIEEEETMCSPQNNEINIFVAKQFGSDAFDTCDKLSRTGTELTEFKSKEQFQLWHEAGNNNKVIKGTTLKPGI